MMNFPLTDDDIRVAVRIWLDTSAWKQRLKIVDEMSAGGLRVHRLRPAIDIIVKDGLPSFDITAREGWDPKTESEPASSPCIRG